LCSSVVDLSFSLYEKRRTAAGGGGGSVSCFFIILFIFILACIAAAVGFKHDGGLESMERSLHFPLYY
jgi:hypothetical protein